MSCNCKKKEKLEEEYGVKVEETIVGKLTIMARKVLMFIILVLVFAIITPLLFGTFIYKAAFTKNMTITLPNFLGKFMK